MSDYEAVANKRFEPDARKTRTAHSNRLTLGLN